MKTNLPYFHTTDAPIYYINVSPNVAMFGGSADNNLVYITTSTLQTIYSTYNKLIQINPLYID